MTNRTSVSSARGPCDLGGTVGVSGPKLSCLASFLLCSDREHEGHETEWGHFCLDEGEGPSWAG